MLSFTKLHHSSTISKFLRRHASSSEKYQKLDPVSHVLLRPGMYVGSIARQKQAIWLPFTSTTTNQTTMILQEASYIPALYKIFDEIIVNAADNYQRDSNMTGIDVTFEPKTNTISIRNDGKGIPVRLHETEKVYVPELVLGNLLTGSNFDDTEGRLTGGAHGFGAKLTNIFSTQFTVETADIKRKKLYTQTWTDNMRTRGEPTIVTLPSAITSDYTKISFSPDWNRFGYNHSNEFWKKTNIFKGAGGTKSGQDDTLKLMLRRVWDVAGVNSGLNVTIDNKPLQVQSFMNYVEMFGADPDNIENTANTANTSTNTDSSDSSDSFDSSDGSTTSTAGLYIRPNRHWEIVVGASTEAKFQQVSFVNSISTLRGGTHVNIMVEQLCRRIADYTNRNHGKEIGTVITSNQVRSHLKIFVSALIENPSFDSQLKESLTTPSNKFGSNPVLSERFTKQVIANSGIVESLVNWARAKEKVNFLGKMKTSKTSMKRLLGIPKLEDANDAGDLTLSKECTLILTEGDSAKALAVAGLAVVGRDKYGVFPLRGKPLNVRDASLTQIGSNEEIKNLVQILGLDYEKTYDNEEDFNSLRYGSVMIMADQDHDGSHIKGLILNALHVLFPSLLERPNFIKAFITPIVKIKLKKKDPKKAINEISFYTIPDYEQWRQEQGDEVTKWNVKYYKGLGTSTALEARDYFTNLDSHIVPFRWGGDLDGERLDMAFRKSRAEDRKQWLSRPLLSSSNNIDNDNNTNTNNNTNNDYDTAIDNSDEAQCEEQNNISMHSLNKDKEGTTMASFVDNELVLFSHADNIRSIPSVVDGLKPSQRKVLYACFKRKLITNEIKVAQLAGYVSEHTAYHHGEASLQSTITNMAQTFVGSNNIPLLYPSGQFGTRLQGGKDAASPRYIFTKLMNSARKIFPADDDPLLNYKDDDGLLVEPIHYVPIIPMALVNGCDGIGTGWSTSIPRYNPIDLIHWIDNKINIELGKEEKKNSKDDDVENQKYIIPWVNGFVGSIEELPMNGKDLKNRRFRSTGLIEQLNSTTLEITELPIGRWTDDMKNILSKLVSNNTVKGYREYHTEESVHFIITLTRKKMEDINKKEGGFMKLFKLEETINTSNMHLFNEQGRIQKYDTVEDVLNDYYPIRRDMYKKRKKYLLQSMNIKLKKLANKAKFLEMVSNGEIVLIKRTKKEIEMDLIKYKFTQEGEHGDEEQEKDDKDVNFDYLLRTPLSSITLENVVAAKKEAENLLEIRNVLEQTKEVELWQKDLLDLKKSLGKEYGKVIQPKKIKKKISATKKKRKKKK